MVIDKSQFGVMETGVESCSHQVASEVAWGALTSLEKAC